MTENNVEANHYAIKLASLERLICELLSKNEQLRNSLVESTSTPSSVGIEKP